MADLSIQRDMQRQLNEKGFEATLRAYMLDSASGLSRDRKYQFGGVLNLISTVRGLLEEMADEFDCKDYSTVAEKLLAVEEQADLSYYHMEDAA